MSEMKIVTKQSYVSFEIDDTKYKFAKVTIGDLSDLQQLIEDKREQRLIAKIKSLYGDNPPAAALDKISQPMTDAESNQAMEATWTGRWILWRSLSTHNPNMTEQEAGALIPVDRVNEIISCILPKEPGSKKKAAAKVKP